MVPDLKVINYNLVWYTPSVPSLGRQRQDELHEFVFSLVYTASPGLYSEGPWLKNKLGLRIVCFWNFPVDIVG